MPIAATGAIIIACMSFAANSVFVKIVSHHFDPWTILFIRFLVGALLAAMTIVFVDRARGKSDGFRITDWPGMLLRTLFGCVQMILFFVGVSMTSSGRATLLNCTHPLFAALFGVLLFGEKLPRVVFFGVIGGFIGTVLVFADGSSYSLLGNLICLIGGASLGCAMHFVKRVRKNHSTMLVYLVPCFVGVVLTAWTVPRLSGISTLDLLILLAVGFLSFLGQILMSWGLKFIPATAGSMLGLAETPFALVASSLVIGEIMPPRFLFGAVVILASLVITIVIVQRSHGNSTPKPKTTLP